MKGYGKGMGQKKVEVKEVKAPATKADAKMNNTSEKASEFGKRLCKGFYPAPK